MQKIIEQKIGNQKIAIEREEKCIEWWRIECENGVGRRTQKPTQQKRTCFD